MVEEMLLRQRLEWREFGTRNIANTTAFTGVWCEIVVITAATFTTLTMEGSTGTWTGVAFPVGHVIRGKITAITLTSGSIQAVNAEPQRATLTTSLSGANNDLVFSARLAGSRGNGISIAYVNPGTPSAALSVGVVARAITVNLATDAGTSQVETATVASGATASANVIVTVTGTALTGSPLATNVAVTNGDTAAVVAGKIRTALGLVAAISDVYTVGGSSATVTLTKTVATANDATLNIGIDGSTNSTGVTNAGTSANTTAGVAPAITSTAALIEAALEANERIADLITITNSGADTGAGVVTAMAATNLAGGAG
jgi:hypothetical protein